MSGQIDPYKILGVSTDATYEEVRQAYRRAATKYHPDAGGDAWAFQQVQQAFVLLREKFENPSPTTGPNDTARSGRSSDGSSTKDPRRRSMGSSTQSRGATGNGSQASTERTHANRDSQNGSSSKSGEATGKKAVSLREWLFGTPLELHDETSYFVLANFMDLVMTGILLRYSAVEANPIANYFYHQFGFIGMVGLKIASVALVVVLAQVIAKRSRTKAQLLLVVGTIVVSAVVVYSMFLARGHILGR